jgi:type IX secretion system PorP/SprF family membrane protein
MKPAALHILLVIASLLAARQNICAQDPIYTQFYAAPVYLSPSFAGSSIQSRFCANYRNQWPGISKAFSSYTASYDQYLPLYNSGIGFIATHDRAGDATLRSTSFAAQYAYEARIRSSVFFRPALQFGFGSRTINFSNLIFGDQLIRGKELPSLEQDLAAPINYFDIATGALLFSKKAWLGTSIHHLTQPKESLYANQAIFPRKLSVHGGFRLQFKENPFSKRKTYIVAAFNYQAQQNFDQLDVGFYLEPSPLVVGIWFRGLPTKNNGYGKPNNDAIAIITGYNAGPYKIGYSYDITISAMETPVSGGAHEITLVYEWANKRNIRLAKRRIVPCAKF